MHLETSAPVATDVALRGPVHDGAPATRPAAMVSVAQADGEDATLRLLRACVEALSLLQGRVEEVEGKIEAVHPGHETLADLRSALVSVQDAVSRTGEQQSQAEARVTRLEAQAQEIATQHADDVGAARTEAANWRMRVETDAMAFDQLSARMGKLEQGLGAKLERTEQAVAEQQAENMRLQQEKQAAIASADQLRTKLSDVDATIKDQRARIACLQNKLATATYAIRFDHMSRSMESSGLGLAAAHDILDLAPLPSGNLVSAA